MIFERMGKTVLSGLALVAVGLLLTVFADLFMIGTLTVAVGAVWIALGVVLALLGPQQAEVSEVDLTEAEIEAAERAEMELTTDPLTVLTDADTDPVLGARPTQPPSWADDEDELWPSRD